jgi:hypothetical protein
MAAYEEDHRLPLTGGGNPSDEYNLYPEPIAQAHVKDQAEGPLGHNLCNAQSEHDFLFLQTQFVQMYLTAYPGYK